MVLSSTAISETKPLSPLSVVQNNATTLHQSTSYLVHLSTLLRPSLNLTDSRNSSMPPSALPAKPFVNRTGPERFLLQGPGLSRHRQWNGSLQQTMALAALCHYVLSRTDPPSHLENGLRIKSWLQRHVRQQRSLSLRRLFSCAALVCSSQGSYHLGLRAGSKALSLFKLKVCMLQTAMDQNLGILINIKIATISW